MSDGGGDLDNLIIVDFRQETVQAVREINKEMGPVRAREFLIAEGFHPSYVTVLVRKVMYGANGRT